MYLSVFKHPRLNICLSLSLPMLMRPILLVLHASRVCPVYLGSSISQFRTLFLLYLFTYMEKKTFWDIFLLERCCVDMKLLSRTWWKKFYRIYMKNPPTNRTCTVRIQWKIVKKIFISFYLYFLFILFLASPCPLRPMKIKNSMLYFFV